MIVAKQVQLDIWFAFQSVCQVVIATTVTVEDNITARKKIYKRASSLKNLSESYPKPLGGT